MTAATRSPMPRLEVTYYPIFRDGSRGHVQTCIVETWSQGRRPVEAAKIYFQEHHPDDRDEIVEARWLP